VTLSPSPPPTPPALDELADLVGRHLSGEVGEPQMRRPCEGLLLLGHRACTDHLAQIYDPVVCLVVQGAKQVQTSDRAYAIEAGQFLVVTHDMPVVSKITVASPGEPYLAVILSLQEEVLAGLHAQIAAIDVAGPAHDDSYAVSHGDADADLLDAFVRCLRALRRPEDRDVLVPLIAREIHYRLLQSSQGHTLRHLGLGHPPAQTISRVIALIRQDLAAQVRVGVLAGEVGLSPSALHQQFKAVTGTTPIQFQKQLRLLEARRLIQSTAQSVTSACYAVGYSSPSQFSREYRRAFGHPPSADMLMGTAR
jgi:AraC-like DNA-binding protein